MLTEQQLVRLDEDIRRLLVEIGRREGGTLEHSSDTIKDFAEALQTLVTIKRNHLLDVADRNNNITF